jgi:hypothetical protein
MMLAPATAAVFPVEKDINSMYYPPPNGRIPATLVAGFALCTGSYRSLRNKLHGNVFETLEEENAARVPR